MTEARQTKKTNRNGEEITVLRDNATYTEDVVWKRDTGNPLIDNAHVHDDLSLTIEFKDKQYDVRSPDIRIVDELEPLMIKVKEESEKGIDPSSDRYNKFKSLTRDFIMDMIPDLDLDNRSIRIDHRDFDNLSTLCWRYKNFLTRKSALSLKG
ncbi:MAG: hypothetical protein GWN00_35615 [Aliifodinibius sp.]|nr:hypothetical protein [candidate division Zixibacteria bacterium]NIR67417.1 hypothetical protein [candidate division Zixibacteria bacterium]NIT61347.1 hypothetical protein [Fodinibius sp.]NIY29927.1 hypothetical protein [Fodinibius sp.]